MFLFLHCLFRCSIFCSGYANHFIFKTVSVQYAWILVIVRMTWKTQQLWRCCSWGGANCTRTQRIPGLSDLFAHTYFFYTIMIRVFKATFQWDAISVYSTSCRLCQLYFCSFTICSISTTNNCFSCSWLPSIYATDGVSLFLWATKMQKIHSYSIK